MRRRVLLVGVVQVVGGDDRQVEVLGQPEQVGADPGLDLQAVVHQLEVVVARPEDVAELRRGRARLVVPSEPQEGLHLARRAAGRGDEPAGVGLEQLAVHPGLVEEALEAGPAGEPEQVVHARGGLGQQRHVGERAAAGHVVAAALAPPDPGAVAAVGARGDVGLDADDRLDAGGGGLLPEVVGPEDVAVVGHREGRHPHRRRRLEEVVQAGRAVEHGVLGVHVQVHERVSGSHGSGGLDRWLGRCPGGGWVGVRAVCCGWVGVRAVAGSVSGRWRRWSRGPSLGRATDPSGHLARHPSPRGVSPRRLKIVCSAAAAFPVREGAATAQMITFGAECRNGRGSGPASSRAPTRPGAAPAAAAGTATGRWPWRARRRG